MISIAWVANWRRAGTELSGEEPNCNVRQRVRRHAPYTGQTAELSFFGRASALNVSGLGAAESDARAATINALPDAHSPGT
jgi:hypothetical protein